MLYITDSYNREYCIATDTTFVLRKPLKFYLPFKRNSKVKVAVVHSLIERRLIAAKRLLA